MYGGGASLGIYSGAYSGMYDDDTCDDNRAAAAASLVGEDESVSLLSFIKYNSMLYEALKFHKALLIALFTS